MRLLILSDLHHEIWREQAPRIDPAASQPDLVILAGDIDTGAHAIAWAAETFQGLPVLYVHGNHESYGHKLESAQADIAEACVRAGNVHFLHCGEYRHGTVRFLGATMWTDFKLFGDDTRPGAMRAAEAALNDYRRIRLKNKAFRKLRAADTAQFHAQQTNWLASKLAEPFLGHTVVISHMAPSFKSVPSHYQHDPVSAAYASRLDHLAEKADLWVHGHTHSPMDYRIGKCRVVCNPCGYPQRDGTPENEEFDPGFIVTVGAEREFFR